MNEWSSWSKNDFRSCIFYWLYIIDPTKCFHLVPFHRTWEANSFRMCSMSIDWILHYKFPNWKQLDFHLRVCCMLFFSSPTRLLWRPPLLSFSLWSLIWPAPPRPSNLLQQNNNYYREQPFQIDSLTFFNIASWNRSFFLFSAWLVAFVSSYSDPNHTNINK